MGPDLFLLLRASEFWRFCDTTPELLRSYAFLALFLSRGGPALDLGFGNTDDLAHEGVESLKRSGLWCR